MEEQIVSLRVAKLLAEHDFCNGSSHYYSDIPPEQLHKNDDGALYLNGLDVNYIEAPTQSLVQKWLRYEKGVIVLVTLDDTGMGFSVTSDTIDYKDSKYYLSYESALENGLYMALKLL
ncbi:hypothetical protein DAC17_115 [Bacteroides phage DAC17]|nr:hypothetical protein DAC17_115 [Bacteroides phage DAC17]